MANNSSTMPHDFSTLGKTQTIATGVYYHLIPKKATGSSHLDSIGDGFWFPVTGDSPIDYSFNHTWDLADNLAKKQIDSIGSGGGISGDAIQLGVRAAQHYLGGSLYASGCALYNTSSPPTINVSTKLFSVGGNNLINIIEGIRGDTHGRLGSGGAAAGVKAGTIEHPGGWDVEVVSFAGTSGGTNIVSFMKDMICVGMKVTMYSPWLGIEPCYMELSLTFQHGYPGMSESMKFGGRL
jgi:hypothetical protein